jgi:hypothetical protein
MESDRRWRATKKRLRAAGWLWYSIGGGTWLIDLPGRKRHPCDIDYENLRTGEIATFYCTPQAYFGALRKLHKAKTIRTILAVPGVKLHSREKPQPLPVGEAWSALVAKRVRFPNPKRAPKSAAAAGSTDARGPRRAPASKKPAGGRGAPSAKGARPAAPSSG